MRFILDFFYLLAIILASPVIAYRVIRHGRYRGQLAGRLGKAPLRKPDDNLVIWIHAVSLGEINAARSIIAEIKNQMPAARIIVSTSTDTGLNQAKKLYSAEHDVFSWPLDFSLVVSRALKRAKPDLVVLMEGEAWPNFLASCNSRDIPAVIVNGRMSPNKGYPRYKKLGPIATGLFNRLTRIGVQDQIYADKFLALGVKPEKVVVTGMLKYDTIQVADQIEGAAELAKTFSISEDDNLIVAGGTGPGEEEIILDAFEQIRQFHSKARLAIVPRKPERFDDVAKLIQSRDKCIRRSQTPDNSETQVDKSAIILGDTMGELRKFYSLSSQIFVGRSLVKMGGSDMIEAAALGKPTCYGPHVFNFPQANDLLKNGCVEVKNASDLAGIVCNWIEKPELAKQAGLTAKEFIKSQQGASIRNVEMMKKLLGR